MFNEIKYSLLLLILLLSCKTPKDLKTAVSMSGTSLQVEIQQFIDCLNAYQFDCVDERYADDFESWEPALKVTDKSAFIAEIKKNYLKDRLHVKAEILECREREGMGYAYLHWELFSIDEQETSAERLLSKKVVQIWEKNEKGKWVLTRSLFAS